MSVPAEQMTDLGEAPERSPTEINLDQLGATLRGYFTEAETERQVVELEWLASLRQYKGIYDPEVSDSFQKGKSRAFIRLTRTKVKSVDARCMDMLFPAGTEKNWQIDPTPVSEIDTELHGDLINGIATAKFSNVMAQVAQMDDVALNEAVAAGAIPDQRTIAAVTAALEQRRFDMLPPAIAPSDDEVLKAINDEAKKRCERMSKRIDDQLTESRYPIISREVIHSGNLLGTGILKGPMVERTFRKKWVFDHKAKTWKTNEQAESYRPFPEFVPVWDVYPDQSVSDVSQCGYIFQRHVMSRAKLRKLNNRPDFDAELIESYIRSHPEGDAQYKSWETDLRNISKDENFKSHERRKNYEVLEFWGVIDGEVLSNCGIEVPEEMMSMDIEVNAWVLGTTVIKLVMNPYENANRPYHFYYFEKDDTSIWGIGIADIYRWAQQICNASMRAALDNLGITAGPVYEINLDLLDDNDRPDEIFPFRIIYRRGKGVEAQYDAVKVHEASSRVSELLKIFEVAKQLGDETTTIPSYTHGEQDKGVSRTVGGLSMLMGAAIITMKDVVRNYDDGITKPFLAGMYDWNMQFGDDAAAKGDFVVSARGSSSLVAKEIYSQQLDALADSTNNPSDGPYTKRLELLRARYTARDLDPDRFIKTQPEVEDELRARIGELEGSIQALQGELQKVAPPMQAAAVA